MTLTEHLRELRNRMFVIVAVLVIGTIVAWVLYGQINKLLLHPIFEIQHHLLVSKHIKVTPVTTGVAGSFLLQTKVCLVAAIVATSPIWLYEIWAFITPGLHRHEKKWTIVFVSIAGPLFVSGVLLGYYVLPKGLQVLTGFTPHGVTNLIDLNDYLDFVLRVLLVFGVSFEIPLFVVMLNLAGIVRARHLKRWRSWIVFLTFVFAAVATPSTDPITMLLLAIPMTLLFLLSEGIAHIIDRRRGRDAERFDDLGDDELSPL